MNAPVRHPVEITTPIDDTMSAYRNLKAAIALYNPDDDYDTYERRKAADAIAENRAAFWSTAKYHNAMGKALLNAANRGESIAEVIKARFSHMQWPHIFECGLNTLVPLNPKATETLYEAYLAFGTWVETRDLDRRVTTDFRKHRKVA